MPGLMDVSDFSPSLELHEERSGIWWLFAPLKPIKVQEAYRQSRPLATQVYCGRMLMYRAGLFHETGVFLNMRLVPEECNITGAP